MALNVCYGDRIRLWLDRVDLTEYPGSGTGNAIPHLGDGDSGHSGNLPLLQKRGNAGNR